ncbi:MAG: hypothetical protein IJ594_00105 [Oscillospiraceae bacterium]|nr:hypothetical protein [Oscillospiraceae bacterium]
MSDYGAKTAELVFGLFLFSVGSYLTVQANVGLSPWWAFDIGLSQLTGIDYGVVHNAVAILILVIDILAGEKIGWGTVGDALLIGAFVSLFDHLALVPLMQSLPAGIACMVLGLLVIAVGSFFYMDAAYGCGPRDALMVALCRKLPRLPVGLVRILLEGSALLIGWLLGAKVGIGTVISVFGVGVLLELVFRVTRFEPTRVRNENVVDTCRNVARLLREKNAG